MDEQTRGNPRFVCVEYPAIVENEDKMLETLGGEKQISKSHSKNGSHLEMKWRPREFYCKPVFAVKYPSTNLLMKVKRKRRKLRNMDGTVTEEVKYETEILGVIGITYKFDGMADFQYLPVERKPSGQYKSLVDQLQFDNELPSHTAILDANVPLFIPPIVFSRFHKPINYMYRADPLKGPSTPKTKLLPGINRKRRTNKTIFVAFDDPVPTEPLELAVKDFTPLITPEIMEMVSEKFQTMPIWSKYRLTCHLPSITANRLKLVLPLVAYFVTSGPWRNLWVRLGYDPKQHIEAKQYQMVDFRSKGCIVNDPNKDEPIGNRRASLWRAEPAKRMSIHKPRGIHQRMKQSSVDTERAVESLDDSYKFLSNRLPAYKMMHFQLCDIEMDEAQEIVHRNDGKEGKCSSTDGWCVKNFYSKVTRAMKRQMLHLMSEKGYDSLMTLHDESSDDECDISGADKELMDCMNDDDDDDDYDEDDT